ncbi:hypothetical protein HY227_02175 [Candidatus Wolfebacteria bacterium]|nr:hypothetical protein [Candidatus Wolfebacteria bacterium]
MRFLFITLLSILLVFAQAWFGFSIFGVKPNLALILIIVFVLLVKNFWEGALFISLLALILKFAAGFQKEILIISLIGLGVFFTKKYFSWHPFLSNIFLIILGTAIFYIFSGIEFILTAIFIKELLLNVILGTAIFALLQELWQDNQ